MSPGWIFKWKNRPPIGSGIVWLCKVASGFILFILFVNKMFAWPLYSNLKVYDIGPQYLNECCVMTSPSLFNTTPNIDGLLSFQDLVVPVKRQSHTVCDPFLYYERDTSFRIRLIYFLYSPIWELLLAFYNKIYVSDNCAWK